MVPADSQQIPRARCYSGNKNKTEHMAFTYRTLTYSGRPFQASSAYHTRSIRRQLPHRHVFSPQPLTRNPGNGHTRDRFSQKSTFVRHYSRNHNCFLLQRVLRCFTSPPYPQPAIHSPAGDRQQRRPGFPIRTSSDQRLVDNSPRLNAASHVLHRPSMPRHPPCATRQTRIE